MNLHRTSFKGTDRVRPRNMMIGYATYSYLTIACIFLMTSSTPCGSYLATFSCYNICQLRLFKFHHCSVSTTFSQLFSTTIILRDLNYLAWSNLQDCPCSVSTTFSQLLLAVMWSYLEIKAEHRKIHGGAVTFAYKSSWQDWQDLYIYLLVMVSGTKNEYSHTP